MVAVHRVRRWFVDQLWERRWKSVARPSDDRGGPTVDPVDEVVEPVADAGMSTVEYAVGTVVAAAFAAVLYKIVTGDSVVAGLTDLVNSALHTSL